MQELLIQATEETTDRSIESIVNQRTAEAFGERQNGGPQVNHGAIAVQARADFLANPNDLRRGKVVVGRLVVLLQQELGGAPRVFFATQHVQYNVVTEIAQAIWHA